MRIFLKDVSSSTVDTSVFPGFRFCPTDEELISYYLKRKLDGLEQSVQVIAEVDICKFEPWDLPGKSNTHSENEWFFFCPRGKKYPNGSQTKRATTAGYWKATGKERDVKSGSNIIGTKRTLVFHIGRAPDGERTDWIMHEFTVKGRAQDSFVVCRLRKKSTFNANEESSTSNSMSQGDHPRTDADLSTVTQLGNEKKQADTGIREEIEETECLSSKQSSNVVQQNVYASDSVQKTGECSGWKFQDHDVAADDCFDDILQDHDVAADDCFDDILQDHDAAADDCFDDILKEDIIQLDYSSLGEGPSMLSKPDMISGIETTSTQKANPVKPFELPSQGTAQRRIRLKIQQPRLDHAENPEVIEVGIEVIMQDLRRHFRRIETIFSVGTNSRLIFFIFKMMALLAVLLLVLSCINHCKSSTEDFVANDRV